MMASVIVVDDDPIFAAFAARVLEQQGHHVLVSAEGNEALKLLDEHGPALVITDIVMPGMEGLEDDVENATAFSAAEDHRDFGERVRAPQYPRCRPADGADAALKKPFQERELIAIVDRVLEREDPTAPL